MTEYEAPSRCGAFAVIWAPVISAGTQRSFATRVNYFLAANYQLHGSPEYYYDEGVMWGYQAVYNANKTDVVPEDRRLEVRKKASENIKRIRQLKGKTHASDVGTISPT